MLLEERGGGAHGQHRARPCVRLVVAKAET
jgi:hypothetical protein